MRTQKLITPILLALSLWFSGCSKEKIQNDLLVDAFTKGRWIVVIFTEGGSDLTSQFAPYEFQFFENKTVQAIKGAYVITGTWEANIDSRTISADFPGTDPALDLLSDNWKIFNNTLTLVEATPVNSGRPAYLKLNRK
jgi:hypothetical protein